MAQHGVLMKSSLCGSDQGGYEMCGMLQDLRDCCREVISACCDKGPGSIMHSSQRTLQDVKTDQDASLGKCGYAYTPVFYVSLKCFHKYNDFCTRRSKSE